MSKRCGGERVVRGEKISCSILFYDAAS
jgi:hypothetical protein